MQRKIRLILLFIILLGASLRIFQLGKEGLTLDEVLTAEKSASALPDLIRYWSSQDHLPVYFIFLHYWMQLVGKSEIALRFPSMACRIAAIYYMFLLGKRLFDEETGLLASCLFALSLINIFHSQWARPYSATVFFTLLSFLCLLEALEKTNLSAWLRYVFFTLLTLLLSISAFPILLCQILFVVFLWPGNRGRIAARRPAAAFSFIGLIYLPLLLSVVINSALKGNLGARNSLNFYSVANIFNYFGGKIYYIKSCGLALKNNQFINPLINIFSATLFLLCLVGLFELIRGKRGPSSHAKDGEGAAGILLPLWLVLPFLVVLPASFAYSKDPVFGSVRYLLYASCPYYLLISKGIISLKRNMRIALCILIILANSLFLYQYYHFGKWTNWREVCAYIKNNLKEDEKVVFIMNSFRPISFVEHAMLRHYAVPSVVGIKTDNLAAEMPERERQIYEKEVNLMGGQGMADLRCSGVWLVSCAPGPGTIKELKDRFGLFEKVQIQGLVIYHFRIAR